MFAALVFFGTATLGLGTLLVLERSGRWISRLTPEEVVNVRVYREASPSVVHLTSEGRSLISSVAGEAPPPSTGSCIVWDERGTLVTNDHLIAERGAARVTMADGSWREVLYVGSSSEYDLAVLFVLTQGERLQPAKRGRSRDLAVGQRVFAIGNPFDLDQSLTVGVVSGLGRRIRGYAGDSVLEGMIQTDAAVNPGNSGGPLLDSRGRVVGINTAIAGSSATSAGVGFALPVETLEQVVPQILREGFEPWPEIGIVLASDGFSSQHLSATDWRNELDLSFGILLLQVLPGSPAEAAGIQAVGISTPEGRLVGRDVLVGVDGKILSSRDQASAIFARKRPGDTVRLQILRGNPGRSTEVELAWGAPRTGS